MVQTDSTGMILFWKAEGKYGFLSNFYRSPFVVEGVNYTCVEQYFMAGKARLFRDKTTLAQILATDSPDEIKALGRQVSGFVQVQWEKNRSRIMKEGLLAKFTQNPALLDKLQSTGGALLAEASPYDAIWGIGLPAHVAVLTPPVGWPGRSLLGNLLMEVRTELRQNETITI